MNDEKDLCDSLSDQIRLKREDEEADIYAASTFKLGLCRCIRGGTFLAVAAALIQCIILAAHFAFSWRSSARGEAGREKCLLQASVFVGMEVGLLVMAALLAYMIPRMIMAWTTALVFQSVFGKKPLGSSRREMLVEDGSKLALELSISTLIRVVTEGNRVGITVGILCLISAAFGRAGLYLESMMLS